MVRLGSGVTRALIDRREDLLVSRVPTCSVLRVNELSIERDFERAPARIDELHFDVVVPCFQGIRQTDGLGTVVSNDAVFDRDVHWTGLYWEN